MIKEIKRLYIEVTLDCNLSCSYCYNRALNRETEMFQAEIIDKLLTRYAEMVSKELSVTLHGGEPLLDLEKCRQIRDVIVKHVPNAEFNIQTNGTLLHDAAVQAFLSKIGRMAISIGFDSRYKRADALQPWTVDFLKHFGNTGFNYVIIDKTDIKNLAQNINYIYDTFGKYPGINYNYFATSELPEVEADIRAQISQTDYTAREYAGVLGVAECGELTIQCDGLIRNCLSKVFGHTRVNCEEAGKFYSTQCLACELRFVCNACPVKVANYQGNLCNMIRAINCGLQNKLSK